MITEKDFEYLETYQIPSEFYTFLTETASNMEGGFNEGLQHLCSRFSVAHDNFMKRENPEVFALSVKEKCVRDTLYAISNGISHLHGAVVNLGFELKK
jgi:hypothetical protein